ncbi:BZ3500_MvSof-1268-A1-R1_Chr1-3g02272 [Microbotryum saponariae]|uniref:BZ3500_MvSof-1268-A1-R1_Chr1-3g02272 protein n=1 Tax=Microbotryum saponariae TaxID=289078 RepID=A0A2X0MNF7_9BASI|nr:BZ3500_MvSof-1268-A1-R1_Chr1-3g02272 [Microbotryum saponariae]SCZ95840.1 BZ3501_MvSof-1269-A2-R1_Chr1-3g01875 [Microbotryum saponariae]
MSSAELKNVAVIGLGAAAVVAAKALAAGLPSAYRVVAISDVDYTYYHIAGLRALVQPGFEDKIIGPLDNVFPSGSRHIVKAGSKVIRLEAHSLTLANGEVIPFAYVVIATGSTYAFPNRAPSDWSVEQLKSGLKQLRGQVDAAPEILVIGGGATGVEFAGEVKGQHGDKKNVTLVHPSKTLFSNGCKEKLGKNLTNSLTALNVKVVVNTRIDVGDLKTGPSSGRTFTLGDGSAITLTGTFIFLSTADFVFIGFGSTPNSELVKAFDEQLVNEKGYVKVKQSLQVAASTPELDHFYAIGDVTDVKEAKQAVTAKAQAPIAAANILASIKGIKSLKPYKPAGDLIVVTVGPKRGAGQMFGFVIGDFFTSKIKSGGLFLSMWQKDYGIKA